MDELNACTECGFTTPSMEIFTSHIEHHEEEHNRSSSGELSHAQTIEWTESDSSTLSPNSVPEKSSPRTAPYDNPSFEDTPPSQLQTLAIGKTSSKTVHVCPHCNFTTYMSQHMKSHLDAHARHQGQMYQCDICQMQFSQKANMHRHRMRHSGVKPYECRYCKKRFFRKDQMQEHSMTHIKTGVDFDCPVAFCSSKFSQHSILRSHLDEAHNISATLPASCKRCSLLFANPRRLLLHYQTRHDDRERSANPITSEDLLMMCLSSSMKQSSAADSSKAADVLAMNLWSSDANLPCERESPSATSATTQATNTAKAKTSMECSHCGVTFFDETMHLLHKGLHSENDPWRCNLCGVQCIEKYMFTTHVIFASHST
ncbi:unnamed protein product [Heligmosomoides polygyrus]|uniref:Zinc finger, C2H2 type n=1 Tax=Heligmosomoides polygyrus TaxID=6339 RepID=A0A183FTN4_HELPZ|nr:unnamed protein product [Heligmosomoides polygyrus]